MKDQNRNQFLTFVYLAALARDVSGQGRDSQFIAAFAAKIPAAQIPSDSMAAAQELIKSFEGGSTKRWMIPPVSRKK